MSPIGKFLRKLVAFSAIPVLVIGGLATLAPATPRASTSLLFSKIDKDALLKETSSPRLILVGGSNLSFGIDSQMIHERLKLNPINTGIHGSIGLPFMLSWVADRVQQGDIVVVAAEYDQFYGDGGYGSEELLRLVLEVDRSSVTKLGPRQWMNSIVFAPKYALSKLKPSEYTYRPSEQIGTHERRAFNRYGDMDRHWSHDQVPFFPVGPLKGSFNPNVVKAMQRFEKAVQEKGGSLVVTYPCYQASSFDRCQKQIAEIEYRLVAAGFRVLGTPERYKIPDELLYDTPYHLLGPGVALRTSLLIEDLQGIGISTEVNNSLRPLPHFFASLLSF